MVPSDFGKRAVGVLRDFEAEEDLLDAPANAAR
jgi:hypothetical protein